jgi:hypothetical protein
MDVPAECSLDGAYYRAITINCWHIHNHCLHSPISGFHLPKILGVAIRCK